MLGICPNCKIKLKEPPFNERKTNEVMLIIDYRNLVETGKPPKSIDKLGYCELCNAKKEDLEKQKK
jgi:hypothetical protein